MNAAIILSPYEAINLSSPRSYDLVLTPDDYVSDMIIADSVVKIFPATSEHRLEWKLLEPRISDVSAALNHIFGADLQPLLKRGLSLSAIKTELRLLIAANKKLEELELNSSVNLDVFYSYFKYSDAFENLPYFDNWLLCQRYAHGKLSRLTMLLDYFNRFRRARSG